MSKATLQRRPLVKQILAKADDDLLVIAGLGSSNWDITEAGDRPLNMPLWGGMGATVGMGLGLAIAQPTKRVLVITGDGDMLMSLGTLATVAAQQPDNLAICVLDNEAFGETGMQATHTRYGVDLPGMAKAAGFGAAGTIYSAGQLATWIPRFYRQPGPLFASIKVNSERVPMVLPRLKEGVAIKNRFREALLGDKAYD